MTSSSTLRPLATRIAASSVPAKGLDIAIAASEAERAALAAAFGLVGVDRLEARLTVRPWRRRGLVVEGRIDATVVQTCVVSLDPFASEISEEVREFFWPAAEGEGDIHREVVIDAAADDEPEPFHGGEIDIGALIADSLSTALDPHPKKPGATIDELEAGRIGDAESDEEEAARSPFAAIARLKTSDTSRE